jgi:hypothetical protein
MSFDRETDFKCMSRLHAKYDAIAWPRDGWALGLRQTEALGLRRSYVDLDKAAFDVDWQFKQEHYRHGAMIRTRAGSGGISIPVLPTAPL